jgi:hypothetical protein
MQRQGFYTKIILTIIAVCLIVVVLQMGISVGTSPAEARSSKTSPKIDVFNIDNLTIDDMKEVIILGDQHTFLVRTKTGINVYRVDYVLD